MPPRNYPPTNSQTASSSLSRMEKDPLRSSHAAESDWVMHCGDNFRQEPVPAHGTTGPAHHSPSRDQTALKMGSENAAEPRRQSINATSCETQF